MKEREPSAFLFNDPVNLAPEISPLIINLLLPQNLHSSIIIPLIFCKLKPSIKNHNMGQNNLLCTKILHNNIFSCLSKKFAKGDYVNIFYIFLCLPSITSARRSSNISLITSTIISFVFSSSKVSRTTPVNIDEV